MTFLFNLKPGIPYVKSPPALFCLSNNSTSTPSLSKNVAADNPAGPAPMIATFLPSFLVENFGFKPCLNPSSLM